MTSTLTYQPTRQRDRYRVFDGRTFLGVVYRHWWKRQTPFDWQHSHVRGMRFSGGMTYTTRTEAAEALRQMRRQEAA